MLRSLKRRAMRRCDPAHFAILYIARCAMVIDPSQPVYFDSDSPPGRGQGYWQMDPDRAYDWGYTASPNNDTLAGRIAQRIVIVMVVAGIPLAALDMLLR
jgi:hypothetical protein